MGPKYTLVNFTTKTTPVEIIITITKMTTTRPDFLVRCCRCHALQCYGSLVLFRQKPKCGQSAFHGQANISTLKRKFKKAQFRQITRGKWDQHIPVCYDFVHSKVSRICQNQGARTLTLDPVSPR